MKTTVKGITKNKENGRIYTPLFIVNSILDLTGYYGKEILNKHVIDNSCGDGAFLCEIVRRYCEVARQSGKSIMEITVDLSEYIHGIEIDQIEHNKCIENVNRVVFDFGIKEVQWDIICSDTLIETEYYGKMDYVLGNPPYVRIHNINDAKSLKQFSFAQSGMTDLYIVFYEIGIKMLKKDGVLGYITPSSFFNSIAGSNMRNYLINNNLIDKIVDLKHFQAFKATTYTTIVTLKKNKEEEAIYYFQFDDLKRQPYFVEKLLPTDFFLMNNFYFSSKSELMLLHKISMNFGKSDISVKNGYATLCDDVFVHEFDFDSDYIIPVVKASKGIYKKIIYPYDKNGTFISEDEIKKDEKLYNYLIENKEKLLKRSNENKEERYWYSFGRSQAISDTYKSKIAINSLVRDIDDLKFAIAPGGIGVYGGLYIISETIPVQKIVAAIKSQEFLTYISLLGKYKSGGYFTFSSKDLKQYLDYKFAFSEGFTIC